MKKLEVLRLYNKYNLHYPPKMLFDLWNDDDNIDHDLLKILFQSPKKRNFVIYCNEKFLDKLDELCDSYITSQLNKENERSK